MMVLQKTVKTACVLTVLAVSASVLPGIAAAQNREPVTPERLTRIENAIRDLQGVVYSAEGNQFDPSQVTGQAAIPGPDSTSASMTVRVSQIERELQQLTGDVERLRYEMEQNNTRLNALTEAISVMGETQARQSMNGGMSSNGNDFLTEDTGPSSGPTSGPRTLTPQNGNNSGATGGPNALGGAGLPDGADSPFPTISEEEIRREDPNVLYEGAFDALLNGNYQEAETGFASFIKQYPDDPRAADAQYRLGEIYLATGANSRAAVAFLDHIKQWPDDARSPEAYLKLGISYSRLDKTAEACQIFSVMGEKFTDISSSLRERLSIERQKAGCS